MMRNVKKQILHTHVFFWVLFTKRVVSWFFVYIWKRGQEDVQDPGYPGNFTAFILFLKSILMMRFSPVLLEVPARDYNFGYPLKIRFLTKTDFSNWTSFNSFVFYVAGFCSFFGEMDETTFRSPEGWKILGLMR